MVFSDFQTKVGRVAAFEVLFSSTPIRFSFLSLKFCGLDLFFFPLFLDSTGLFYPSVPRHEKAKMSCDGEAGVNDAGYLLSPPV